jgi:hypothetical protein
MLMAEFMNLIKTRSAPHPRLLLQQSQIRLDSFACKIRFFIEPAPVSREIFGNLFTFWRACGGEAL